MAATGVCRTPEPPPAAMPLKSGVPGWVTKWLPTALLMIVMSAGGWMMGAARADARQEAEIQAIRDIQSEQRLDLEHKVGKEEFGQYTKGIDERLALIQKNTDLILQMQRQDLRSNK